jgi:hypothetical protein
MSIAIQPSDCFTSLPDERTLAETVVALEERGFSADVVDDLDAARERVLARIPGGSSVMTNQRHAITRDGTLVIASVLDRVSSGHGHAHVRGRGDASVRLRLLLSRESRTLNRHQCPYPRLSRLIRVHRRSSRLRP